MRKFCTILLLSMLSLAVHAAPPWVFMSSPAAAGSPPSLTLYTNGAAAWWSASYMTNYSDGALVSTNYDLTGQNLTGTQSGSIRPVFRQVTSLNSKPGWEFAGTQYWDIANSGTSVGDFTAFVVVQDIGGSYTSRILDKTYNGGFWLGRGSATNIFHSGIRFSSSPYGNSVTGDSTKGTMMVRRSGTTQIIWLNGVYWGSWTCDGTATDTSSLRIGSEGTTGWKGFINEILYFTNAISLADCTNNMTFLTEYYRTTGGYSTTNFTDSFTRANGSPGSPWFSLDYGNLKAAIITNNTLLVSSGGSYVYPGESAGGLFKNALFAGAPHWSASVTVTNLSTNYNQLLLMMRESTATNAGFAAFKMNGTTNVYGSWRFYSGDFVNDGGAAAPMAPLSVNTIKMDYSNSVARLSVNGTYLQYISVSWVPRLIGLVSANGTNTTGASVAYLNFNEQIEP